MTEISYLDILMIPITFAYIFLMIMIATKLKRSDRVTGSQARKIVHIGVGTVVVALPWIFESRTVPVIIGICFILITYFTSPASVIEKIKLSAFEEGHPMGTVYYSLSFTTLLYLEFDTFWIVVVCFLPLVYGDAFASITGEKYGKRKIGGIKTVEGAFGGFIATFLSLGISLTIYSLTDLISETSFIILIIVLSVSLLTTIVELLSPNGLDNLFIPLGNWIFITIIFR